MEGKTLNTLQTAVGKCCAERHCAVACSLRDSTSPADVAETILSKDVPREILTSVSTCSLCGLCNEACPHGVDVQNIMKHARSSLIEQGVLDPECYRHLWVDHDWNVFTLFRAQYGLNDAYQDLIKDRCATLFMPGCALANMSPELVRRAAEWIASRVQDVGVVLECCGATLDEMAAEQRSADYSKKLWAYIKQTGATTIVTACPTCHSRMTEANDNPGIEVISLFRLMADAGVLIPASKGRTITVHDSCTDREGSVGAAVREMLTGTTLAEMRHHGRNTICCGSGGLVSAVAPEICEQRAQERLKEVYEVEAETCLTYCMSCAHRLSRAENDNASAASIRHVLEFVFDVEVDHREFEAKARALFEGERGEENIQLLNSSTLIA
jgi:fumarate reductase (CoM/CoB) subunit B